MPVDQQSLEEPDVKVVRCGPSQYRKAVVDVGGMDFGMGRTHRMVDDEEWGEESYDDPDVEVTFEGDSFVHHMYVPSVFHKFIVGTRGVTKQRLEIDSGASIQVPDKDTASDTVVLKAREKQAVYSARAQIELLIEKEEDKLDYTHFLSIPLNDGQFHKNVEDWKSEVLEAGYGGIDGSLFMQIPRLHFTICMLKLHTDAQMQSCVSALKEASASLGKALKGVPLTCSMHGLHIMNDDPREVDVVFTGDLKNSDLTLRTNAMADVVFDFLKKSSCVSEASLNKQRVLTTTGNAEVKLHCTLMNTKYRRGQVHDHSDSANPRRRFQPREPFDASNLLKEFGQAEFGTFSLSELHISSLSSFRNDGYYSPAFVLPLPR
mmetsp:Transcript_15825/g.34874  ORF Transcript_15825/g.34874 Transcript_15825/m.34874 type:complete len:376 (-) Transcript_15825:62-1189(-)